MSQHMVFASAEQEREWARSGGNAGHHGIEASDAQTDGGQLAEIMKGERRRIKKVKRLYGEFRAAYGCEFESDERNPGTFENLDLLAILEGWTVEELETKIKAVVHDYGLQPVQGR